MPQRIQRKRTAGYKLPEGAICVSRPSVWGNPYPPGVLVAAVAPDVRTLAGYGDVHPSRVVDLTMSLAFFSAYVRMNKKFLRIHELAGHDLACWCRLNEPCHADILLCVANTPRLEPVLWLDVTAADIAEAEAARQDKRDPLTIALTRLGYTGVYSAPGLLRCDQALFRPSYQAYQMLRTYDLGQQAQPQSVLLEDMGYIGEGAHRHA